MRVAVWTEEPWGVVREDNYRRDARDGATEYGRKRKPSQRAVFLDGPWNPKWTENGAAESEAHGVWEEENQATATRTLHVRNTSQRCWGRVWN